MPTLAIYFDLQQPSTETPGLQNYLESFDVRVQAGGRLWFVNTSKTATAVRDEIGELPFMSGGHTTVVLNVGAGWGYHGDVKVSNWIHTNWQP